MPEGLLIIRLAVGVLLFMHGAQKLFGWFGGHGLHVTGAFFDAVGHRPGRRMAMVAGAAEAVGGLLIALGLLTPLGAAMVIGTMVVAAVSVHKEHGLWAADGGYELPMTYALVAAGLAFTGAGDWSIDAAAGIGWTNGAGPGLLAVLVALVAAGLVLSRRNRTLEADVEAEQQARPAYPQDVAADPATFERR
jgi:putative oxidoreductase